MALQFGKCCFCLPLRCGIILWGYIKLLPSIVLAAFLSLLMWDGMLGKPTGPTFLALLIMLGFIILFTIFFLIGAHMKSVIMIRMCFSYSIIEFVIFLVTGVTVVYFSLYDAVYCRKPSTPIKCDGTLLLVFGSIAATTACLAVQLYFILLVRSEILNLDHEAPVLFVNVTCDEFTDCEDYNEDDQKGERVPYGRLQNECTIQNISMS